MKKVITATVLVAFMGAVAFASLETRNSSVKNKEQKKEIKKEQKETKKKKDCRRTCLFS